MSLLSKYSQRRRQQPFTFLCSSQYVCLNPTLQPFTVKARELFWWFSSTHLEAALSLACTDASLRCETNARQRGVGVMPISITAAQTSPAPRSRSKARERTCVGETLRSTRERILGPGSRIRGADPNRRPSFLLGCSSTAAGVGRAEALRPSGRPFLRLAKHFRGGGLLYGKEDEGFGSWSRSGRWASGWRCLLYAFGRPCSRGWYGFCVRARWPWTAALFVDSSEGSLVGIGESTKRQWL